MSYREPTLREAIERVDTIATLIGIDEYEREVYDTEHLEVVLTAARLVLEQLGGDA